MALDRGEEMSHLNRGHELNAVGFGVGEGDSMLHCSEVHEILAEDIVLSRGAMLRASQGRS